MKIRMERIFIHGVHGILVLFHEFLVPMKPQCLTCLQIWVKINCIDFHSLIVKFLSLFPMIHFPTLILMYLENFRTAVCIWTSFHFNYILFARTLLTFVCLAFSHWKLSFLLRQLLSCVDIRPLELVIYWRLIDFTNHGKSVFQVEKIHWIQFWNSWKILISRFSKILKI